MKKNHSLILCGLAFVLCFFFAGRVGQSQETREIFIANEIDAIGVLIDKGDYVQADKRWAKLKNQYNDFSKLNIDNAHEKLFAEYRVTLDRKLSKAVDKNSFSLDGVVTKKSQQEGSGDFWNFEFKSNDGIEYVFACSSYDKLRYQVDGVEIDQFKGYEKLKNAYQIVKMIIPRSKYDYVINKCKNKGCDGTCPTMIMMSSSAPTEQQSSNNNKIERARQEFAIADKELNTTYKIVMGSLSSEKQAELKRDQISWIKMKEAAAVQEANKTGDKNSLAWTIRNLEYTTKVTKERTSQLNLINNNASSKVSSQARNISPPNLPYVKSPSCPFEGCQYGKWKLRKPLKLYSAPDINSVAVADLKVNEKIDALSGQVITSHYGIVNVVKKTKISSNDNEVFLLKPGDVLYEMSYLGEGICSVFYKGKIIEIPRGWDPDKVGHIDQDSWGQLVQKRRSDWWVKVFVPKTKMNGWIVNPEADGMDMFG